MQLEFATGSGSRSHIGVPEPRLVNMVPEGDDKRSKRVPRPGLKPAYVVGSGPTWLFWRSGVFGDAIFAVSSGGFYKGQVKVGTIGATGDVQFDSSDSQLVTIDIAAGVAWCYDGSTLSKITDPDLPPVQGVFYLSGRFYYLVKDSDQVYFSAIGDATSISGLAFFTAEDSPDPNLGAAVVSDEVYLFGKETVEPFAQTTDANNPLQRTIGRVFDRGCIARRSIARLDNSVFWVGNDLVVYRAAGVPSRVSTHGVEEKLRLCTDPTSIYALPFSFEGKALYILNIPGQGSYVLDIESGEWPQFTSQSSDLFRPNSVVTVNGVVYAGDRGSGQVWTLDATTYADGFTNGSTDLIERVASLVVDVPGGFVPCNSVMVNCARGVGLGDGSDAVIQLRYSDDQGRTWSGWRDQSLGKIGAYNTRPIWRRLGKMRAPGRTFELRTTDPVLVVYLNAQLNAV